MSRPSAAYLPEQIANEEVGGGKELSVHRSVNDEGEEVVAVPFAAHFDSNAASAARSDPRPRWLPHDEQRGPLLHQTVERATSHGTSPWR